TSILAQLEAADTSSGRVSVFEELLSLANDAPERIEPFLTLIQNAFVEPMPDLRRLAFQCAIKYVSANPSMSAYFATPYMIALLHEEAHISRDALSFLPQFIVHSRSCADALLEAGSTAASRWPSAQSSSDLALARAATPLDMDDVPAATK
uniref:CCR4-NOT transcription complex subunit 11 n=1 Tax=Parascaris univalens TaxID=6257 RepID=A0A915CFE8_PARUN